MLSSYRVEQQAYRSCMSLLKLSDEFSLAKLESACERALFYTPRPGCKQVLSILKSGLNGLPVESPKLQEKASQSVTGSRMSPIASSSEVRTP